MDEPGQQIALTVLALTSLVMAVALPVVTLRRLRSREQRRDEWLGANAQPRLTAVAHGLSALLSIGGVLGCALGAIAGRTFLWALAALCAGILASTIISAVVVLRTARDPG